MSKKTRRKPSKGTVTQNGRRQKVPGGQKPGWSLLTVVICMVSIKLSAMLGLELFSTDDLIWIFDLLRRNGRITLR